MGFKDQLAYIEGVCGNVIENVGILEDAQMGNISEENVSRDVSEITEIC